MPCRASTTTSAGPFGSHVRYGSRTPSDITKAPSSRVGGTGRMTARSAPVAQAPKAAVAPAASSVRRVIRGFGEVESMAMFSIMGDARVGKPDRSKDTNAR
jgi:hypothetical protein